MCCYRVYVLTDKPLLYSSCGRRLFGRPYQLRLRPPFTSLFPNSPIRLKGHPYAPRPPSSGEAVAAYGRMERVHRSHGCHRRTHGAIGGANATTAPPPAPSPSRSLTSSCQPTYTTYLLCLPAALAARCTQGQAARTHVVDIYERGVLSTPPLLLKHSPQEARCTEGEHRHTFSPPGAAAAEEEPPPCACASSRSHPRRKYADGCVAELHVPKWRRGREGAGKQVSK